MKEEWLFPNAIVPVDVETTAALVAEIHRLIGVVGGMALAQLEQEPVACQYAKDVAMPEYRCVGRCQYDTSPQRILELEALLERQTALLERQTARIVDLQTHIENFDGEDR